MLRVTANPNITISRAHVPLKCQLARVVLLGPLTLHDVDAASFMRYAGGQPALLAGAAPAAVQRMYSWLLNIAAVGTRSHGDGSHACISHRLSHRGASQALFHAAADSCLQVHASITVQQCCWRCRHRPAGFWDRLLNRNQLIGLMAQGFQRDLGSAGEVLPLPAPSKQLLVRRGTSKQQQQQQPVVHRS